MFLWREKERDQDEDPEGEIINLRLAKHRNGPTGEHQALLPQAPDALRLLCGRGSVRHEWRQLRWGRRA